MEMLLMYLSILAAAYIVLAVPVTALWDIAAFIDYLAKRKAEPEKRRRAENNFLLASVCLTVSIVIIAVFFLVEYAEYIFD